MEGPARSLVLVLIVAACGGRSVLTTDGDAPAEDDDPGVTGGRPGAGGSTPAGGAFTGGASASGGAFPMAGTTSGGAFPMAGTGSGGAPLFCSDRTGSVPRDQGITWDARGVIALEKNAFGVQGSWFTADDCGTVPARLACTTRDPSLTGPDGQMGWATSEHHVCARGIAPQVARKEDGSFAYAEQWGFLSGFTFNHGMPWNARERCVYGIAFDVAGMAPALLRVNLTTSVTQGVAHFLEVPVPRQGPVSVAFTTFKQGPWVRNPTALDPALLTSLEFHVYTNQAAPTPFSFCVSNVKFLYETLPDSP
ncbi:MAG TPA: hypothetical protein VFZ53_32275 [Polyangiaceae bacterium]